MDLSYSPACEIREPDTFSKENDFITYVIMQLRE